MNSGRKIRVYYVCNAPLFDYSKIFDENFYHGAGARKVAMTSAAMAAVGCKVDVVCSPSVSSGKRLFYPSVVGDLQGVTTRYMAACRVALLNRLMSMLNYTKFALSAPRSSFVVFYGTNIDYVLCAIVLKLRGVRAFLDIEDAPREGLNSLRHISERLAYRILRAVSARGVITVSHALAERMNFGDYCVNYGVVSGDAPLDRRYTSRSVLFSGSMCEEWGLNLFSEAVRLLASSQWPEGVSPPKIYVTGNGGEEELKLLKEKVAGKIDIELRLNSTFGEYQAILSQCEIGLDLRIPGTEGALTTFPSKVLELASSGLALISTGTSDVPLIFDDNQAVILKSATAPELVRAIRDLILIPGRAEEIASRGRVQVLEKFNELAVGSRLAAFLLKAENNRKPNAR